jgi:hypothetical protein
MKRIIFALLIVFLFKPPPALATATLHDVAEWWVTTSEWVTMGWDASVGAQSYECQITCVETGRITVLPVSDPALTKTFRLPRTGHYVAEVKACAVISGVKACSAWASSINVANHPIVNGVDRIWRIYGYLAPPGPIIIK